MTGPGMDRPPALALALCELALAAGPFLHTGRAPMSDKQKRLLAALVVARSALKGGEGAACPLDPEKFLQLFVAGGGDWRGLVAAVNRIACDAAVQRHQHRQQDAMCERTPK